MDTLRSTANFYDMTLKWMLKTNFRSNSLRPIDGNVFRLATPYAATYLVRTKVGCALIDTDLPRCSSFILKNLSELGFDRRDLKFIFLTHGHIDHAGSANELREQTDAKIVVGRFCPSLGDELSEVPLISGSLGKIKRTFLKFIVNLLPRRMLQADFVVSDEQSLSPFGLDGYCLETPGHTAGSISIVLDRKIVFVGDVFGKIGSQAHPNNFADDPEKNFNSIQKLRNLHKFLFLPGHKEGFLEKDIYYHADK